MSKKKRFTLGTLLFFGAVWHLTVDAMAAETGAGMQYPAFDGEGGVFPIEGSHALPAGTAAKLVLDVREEGKGGEPHSGLTHAARALNLFALAGAPEGEVSVAVVVHGKATPLVLSDEAYRRAHGRANPNTALLRRLRDAGVDVKVCGQSLHHHGYSPDDLSEHVTLELSAMTALVELQNDGYALIP